jgi:hypothetical protein
MGDPDSEDYSPELYQQLWAYDQALANGELSKNTTSKSKQFYSVKKPSRRGGGASRVGTIGSPVNLGNIDLRRISGQGTGVAPVQRVRDVRARDLVKKRKISVSK